MLTYKAAMAGADVEHAKIIAAEHHSEADDSISSTHVAEIQSDLDAANARREALLASKAQHVCPDAQSQRAERCRPARSARATARPTELSPCPRRCVYIAECTFSLALRPACPTPGSTPCARARPRRMRDHGRRCRSAL